MKEILFICSRNKWRSPTAEFIYKNDGRVKARSAGTTASARVKVSSTMVLSADIIFVMEHEHKKVLQQFFRNEISGKDIIVMDIPDEYEYMDGELIEMIKEIVEGYL